MKKNTFYSLLFCGMIAGCYGIEKNNPTYEIAKAESDKYKELATDSDIYEYLTERNPDATQEMIEEMTFGKPIEEGYRIECESDSIKVIDPILGRVIHVEGYDSGSKLAESIIKDNE